MTYAQKLGPQRQNRVFLACVVAFLLASCGKPESKGSVQNATDESYRLGHFSQDITSPTDHLTLSVNQSVQVPVTIKNPSSDTWFASGTFPVHISFKWFSGGQLLPIEGDRTALALPQIRPNDSVKENVLVVAPAKPGSYDVQITLVQEDVAWFNLAGAKPLIIPTVVQ